jgi:hypothetical protein
MPRIQTLKFEQERGACNGRNARASKEKELES